MDQVRTIVVTVLGLLRTWQQWPARSAPTMDRSAFPFSKMKKGARVWGLGFRVCGLGLYLVIKKCTTVRIKTYPGHVV